MDTFDLTALNTEQIEAPEVPSPKKIARTIVSRTASYAVSGVVVSIIHQNTTTYNNRQKAQLYIGAWLIGAMVADKAADYVVEEYGKTIDSVIDWLWIPVEPELPASAAVTDPIQDPTEQ